MNMSRSRTTINLQQITRNFSSSSSSSSSPLTTHITSLQSFAQTQNLKQGQKTHSQILKTGLITSPLSITSLINMYSKSHSISDALSLFEQSVNIHNIFIYNAIISGLTINNYPTKAFELFTQMRQSNIIVPDKFTFPCVIKSCPGVSELVKVHGMLFRFELVFDMFICSALLHCYLKFGLVKNAVKVFDKMPERNDVVIWNAMINGFVGIGEIKESLGVFKRMGGEGVVGNEFTFTGVLSGLALAADVINGRLIHGFVVKMGFYGVGIEVKNALIDMYGKCRELKDAMVVFDGIGDKEKDIYSWNSIVVVHEQCGDHDGALRLLKGMIRSGFEPDLITVAAAFPACSHLSALMHGKEIHGFMIRKGLDKAGTHTYNAVMDMYAKCGSMRECRLIFDRMEVKDLASWNIMVMGYGMRGFGNEALDLFSCLCEQGLKPDAISFVGVLSACSHGGLLTQGLKFLEEMQPKYGVTPVIEHYACVVDMLGRAGRLIEALDLISSMPIAPNQVLWRAFLSACVLHGNADLAQVAQQRALELDPRHCGNYVLMSNTFGEAGKYEEVAELRHSMRKQDVKKSPGCSWIELSNVMHVFFTGDHTHPEEDSIYDKLDSLYACLRELGHGLDAIESCL